MLERMLPLRKRPLILPLSRDHMKGAFRVTTLVGFFMTQTKRVFNDSDKDPTKVGTLNAPSFQSPCSTSKP
jgi:hypothetical protein